MLKKVEISHKTVIFTVLFLLFLGFLYLVRDIILELFVALLIMAILNPLVSRLSRFRVPRALSVILVYVVVLGLFGLAVAGIIPPLVEQTTSFANHLPKYLANLGIDRFVSDQITGQLLGQIGGLPSQVVKISFSVFSNLLAVIAVLMFSFYLLLVRDKLDSQLAFFWGEDREKGIASLLNALEFRLGGWARGEFTLMFLVGFSTFLGLTILGIPFALPLGILAGLLEIVPYFGPILAAVPSVLIGLSISPLMGLAAAALAFLIQQVENYIFVPKVMEKSAGVSPIITLLALSIGFRLAGIVGAVISVPVVLTIQVLISEHILNK